MLKLWHVFDELSVHQLQKSLRTHERFCLYSLFVCEPLWFHIAGLYLCLIECVDTQKSVLKISRNVPLFFNITHGLIPELLWKLMSDLPAARMKPLQWSRCAKLHLTAFIKGFFFFLKMDTCTTIFLSCISPVSGCGVRTVMTDALIERG